MTDAYYDQVAAAFNRAAGTYGSDYGANPIMSWLAEDTFSQLSRLFPAGSRLLEIGCGTGEMAIRLAEAGRTVVATDIAPDMIAEGRSKVMGSRASERLTWLAVPAGEIGSAVVGPFDGAYSNFGALNCEPRLAQVADALARLLPTRAVFFCSAMNRWCAWEIAWGLLRLRPREAGRRLGRGWRPARMSAAPGQEASIIPVRYFTPREFVQHFRPWFRLQACMGYPTLIPPPYLAHRWPAAPARLGAIERRLRGLPGLRSLGDHFAVLLRREGQEPDQAGVAARR